MDNIKVICPIFECPYPCGHDGAHEGSGCDVLCQERKGMKWTMQ